MDWQNQPKKEDPKGWMDLFLYGGKMVDEMVNYEMVVDEMVNCEMVDEMVDCEMR